LPPSTFPSHGYRLKNPFYFVFTNKRLATSTMGNKSSGGARGFSSIEQPSPEELAGMKPAGQKGWKLRVEAAGKLASRTPFGRESRLESAAELAEKAATQFKLAKMYDEAGECYSMQADALTRNKETMQAASAMIQAAEVYGKMGGNVEAAYEVYSAAIELYKDDGKFDRAGKHQQALAEVSNL
jgi:tetratricopeptide (TPR) repeat protein